MLGEWQLTPAQAEKTVVLKVPPALQMDPDSAAIPFPRKRGLGDLPLTKKQIEEKVSDVWFDKENDWGIDKSYTVQLYRAEEFARSLVEKHREAVFAETNRKIKKLEEDNRFPLEDKARESLEPSAPEPFNPQFLQKAVQNQLVKLRRNQLPAVRKKTIAEGQVSPEKVVETTFFFFSLVETPLPEGVTVARGSQQALANTRAFGGAEILRSDLPPVLFGVSLSGVPTSLSATRRAGGRTSANVSLFTSEATAADYALTYRNTVEIARQEVLPDNLEKTIETLHRAIIADRHMGMIPDELYADNLTKWLNFASEEGQKFWAANNDSPTEVYKAYLRERNAALGIKVNPVTLSVKQLAKRKVDGVTVTKVNKNDIPKEALVVGDIPNAINNVRVFSDKLKLYNRASAGILPELIFAANVPVNRLGLRIVPRADELRLFSPATTRTKQGRSKGIGLTPRQRRIQSLPSTVEGPATKPKAFDTPEEGPRRSTKNLASLVGGTWSAKFIEKIKGEIPNFQFREALRLRDADLKAVFVDGDWNPSLAGQMDSLVNQTDPQPLLSMSTATKKQQALELWKLATGQPRTKNLDVITIADFIRGEFPKTYSGVKLKQLTKKTRDKFGKETEVPGDFVPETVEIVPNPKVIDPKTGKPRTETLVVYETKGDSPNIPVLDDDGKQIKEQFNYYRYVRGNREDSIPRHYILKGREELRQHLKDTMTNSGERRINAMEKVVILSNLFSHMQRRGANAGWWGKSMAATRDKFARAFDLANFSQASKLAADVVRAEEGIKYQIERGLYSAQLDANLLAHNAGLASVAEIHQGIHQAIKNNSESAWDVTSDPRKNQPGTSLQWKNLNAYFHGTPEKGFKDGVWAVLERGETPVNPPSVQRKIAAGEELEVYDVTGEQLRLYADILNDMYMESVLYELAKESQNSLDPDKFLKIAFENYFPRYYDMNLSRRVFEQKRNAGIETYGDFMSDRLEAAGISELSGSQLHQDFWEPSTPFEQQLRDAFYRVRQGTPATSAEEVLWGGRRKTWQKMKAAGIDPQDFGFVYGGTDRISEMINAGFVPSTSNIVELYQFKRGQIDKYLQKRKVYRVLEEANAIQTIPEKTFKALRNHYTKSTGHDILEFFDIVGVGNKVDPEEKYKAQDGGSLSKARERSLGLAKLLDNEAEKKVDADKIILMDKNAALLVSRFFQPESLYQPGAKHLLVPQDAYRVWRETNNILQNVQLGIGFFHVGTMISESMGTSLESLSAALFHINKRKTAEGMIEYPRPLGDEKLGPAKIPVEVEQSLMMGRLLKFGLAGLAVVRDAGHQEGLHRGLASKLGLPEEKASKGSRKYTRYPKGGSLPLQILATFYAPLKRDSAFIKSFQEKVAKFINNRRAKKGLPETVSPEELFTGVPVRNNSMEQLDKSMGALIEHMSTGILPENATESVIKSVIQQMILGNMQFPSQIYGTKFQLELAKKGQSMVETTVNRLQRGEDLFNYGSVPDPAYIEGFKKLANRTVNMSAWMFDSMIPQAKLAGFLERFRYTLAELGPDATPFQIRKAAQQIQDSIDNRFGQVHYPNLFWEQKSREIMHLAIRSVGWNMGTLKEVLYGGPKDAIKYGLLKTVRAGEAALGVPKAQRKASVGEIDKWSTRAGYASVMIPWKIVQGSMLQLALAGSLPEIAYDEDGNINFVKTLRNFIAPLDGQFDSLGKPTRILSPDYARDVGSLLIAGSEGGLLGLGGALGTMSWHKASPTVHYLTGLASAAVGPNKTFFGREIIRSKGTNWGKFQDFLAYSGEQFLPFSVGTAWYQLSTLDQPLNSALFNGLFGFTPANAWYRNSALDRHLSTAYDDSSGPAIDNLSYEEKLMMEELFQTIRSGWNSEELGKRTEAFEALNQLFNTLPPENVPSIVAQWEGFSPTVGRLIRDILDISNPLDTRSHRELARATLTQVLDARGIGTLLVAGSLDKWKDIQEGFKTKPLTAVDSKIKSTNSAFIRESDNPAFVAAAVAVATPFERAIMITADHLGRYGKPPENYVQKTLTKEDLEIFGGNTGSVELGQKPFSPMIRAYFNSRVSDETRTDIKSDIYYGRFQEKLFTGTEIEMANDLVFPFMAGQAIPQETIDKYGPEDLDQQSRILLERHNKIVEANPPIPPTNMRIK